LGAREKNKMEDDRYHGYYDDPRSSKTRRVKSEQEISGDKGNTAEGSIEPKKSMPRWKKVVSGILAAGAICTAYSSFFITDQTEQAVVTRFGNPTKVVINPFEVKDRDRIIKEVVTDCKTEGISYSIGPGIKTKLPFIEGVVKLDNRLQEWNGCSEQIPTKDKRYIWTDPIAIWYIENPLNFVRTVKTKSGAYNQLNNVLDGHVRDAISGNNLIELVRTDNRKMHVDDKELEDTLNVDLVSENKGRQKILQDIVNASKEVCRIQYGIGIPETGGMLFRDITYVASVKAEIEQRMKEERNRIAKKYISEGDGEYQRIMGEKERMINEIKSGAYKTIQIIKGTADAEATKIYAEGFEKQVKNPQGELIKTEHIGGYNRDPKFYEFTRTLRLYRDSLPGDKTQILLGTDNEIFKYFKSIEDKK
jgi:modulator of FtsH protease HflC